MKWSKKNDVIDIFKFKKCLSNEEEEWIRDAFFVSSYIVYNNIDQETKHLSTYENKWPGSINNSFKTKCNIELGMLTFPLNLSEVDCVFGICQLKDMKVLKMGENHDDIAIFKYIDMIKNKR